MKQVLVYNLVLEFDPITFLKFQKLEPLDRFGQKLLRPINLRILAPTTQKY